MPGVRVDGMDVLEVYKATQEAVDRAKKGRAYINRMIRIVNMVTLKVTNKKLSHQMIVMRIKCHCRIQKTSD